MNYFKSPRSLSVLIAFVLTTFNPLSCAPGNSYFTPRPVSSSLAILQPMYQRFDAMQHKEGKEVADTGNTSLNLHVTPFYQKSTTSGKLRRAMLPNGKDEIKIGGAYDAAGNPTAPASIDVSSTWLQVAGVNSGAWNAYGAVGVHPVELYLNQYRSTISLKPNFERYGAHLDLNKYFKLGKVEFFITASLATLAAEHDLGIKEYDITSAAQNKGDIAFFETRQGGANGRTEAASDATVLSAAQGLNNPLWNYGRLANNLKMQGITDTTLELGIRPLKWLAVGLQTVIPTSKKNKGIYLFAPQLGNNNHWGVGGTVRLDVQPLSFLHFGSALEYTYLLSGKEMRSFDLKNNGPWSRYLLVVQTTAAGDPYNNPEPAINFFTQNAKITPNHQFSWTNELSLQLKKVHFNMGLSVGYQNKEKVSLNGDFADNIFIAGNNFDLDGAGGFEIHNYNATATIAQRYNNPPLAPGVVAAGQTPLSFSDLSLQSATQPSRTSLSVYGAFSIPFTWHAQEFTAGAGISYENNKFQNSVLASISLALKV